MRGRIVREGLRVALAGPPNAGKSSLLNALAQSDVAIVTDEAGTTRDVREVALDLGGQLVILLDMAGLRDTDSKAEAEGVRRARAEIARADLVLWLDAPDIATRAAAVRRRPVWPVATKADLGAPVERDFAVSAATGAGLDDARRRHSRISRPKAAGAGEPCSCSAASATVPALTARGRALQRCLRLRPKPEIAAEHLRRRIASLERLLGRIDTEHGARPAVRGASASANDSRETRLPPAIDSRETLAY